MASSLIKKAGKIIVGVGLSVICIVVTLFQFHLILPFPFYMTMLVGFILTPFGFSLLAFDLPEEKRKKIAKTAFIGSFVLIGVGYASSKYEIQGARIETIFGIVILCFYYGSITFKNKFETWKIYARSKRDAFILSLFDFVGVGCLMLAFLFNFQNWPGSRVFLLIGVITMFVGIMIWKRILRREVFFRKEAEDKVKEALVKIEESHKEIRDSINYAKRLQDAILPPVAEIEKEFPESFVLYKPKDVVAGDFYWFENQDGTSFLAAADCTGHGVPGAMVSVVCSNALNRVVSEMKITDPGKILDKVNELVEDTFQKSNEEVKDGMDISLMSWETGIGSSEKIKIKWSGANNPLWIVRNKELIEIKADKQPIGYYDNRKPFTTNSIEIEKGDCIYLFTDGYADQFGGPKGKKFKYKQLSDQLIAISDRKMAEQKKSMIKTLEEWRGNLEQVDDICIIGIRL